MCPLGEADVDLSAPIDVYSDWIDAAEAVGHGRGGVGDAEDEYEDEGVDV
jgi:transcription elongation factor Elf1